MIACIKVLLNGRQPSLCHWMGLARGPVFDKLWQLTDRVVAWTPFGKLTQHHWFLSGFPHLCFCSFSAAISDFSSGLRWHESRMEAVRQVKTGSRFQQWKFRLSKQHVICIIHPFYCSVWIFSLFVLSAYHACAAAIDYGISPNQTASLCVSESVQSVGCQLFSPALKDVREGRFNMSDAGKLMWMSVRSVWRSA